MDGSQADDGLPWTSWNVYSGSHYLRYVSVVGAPTLLHGTQGSPFIIVNLKLTRYIVMLVSALCIYFDNNFSCSPCSLTTQDNLKLEYVHWSGNHSDKWKDFTNSSETNYLSSYHYSFSYS